MTPDRSNLTRNARSQFHFARKKNIKLETDLLIEKKNGTCDQISPR